MSLRAMLKFTDRPGKHGLEDLGLRPLTTPAHKNWTMQKI